MGIRKARKEVVGLAWRLFQTRPKFDQNYKLSTVNKVETLFQSFHENFQRLSKFLPRTRYVSTK